VDRAATAEPRDNGMTRTFDVADVEVRAATAIATRLLPFCFLFTCRLLESTAIFFFLCSSRRPADSQAASQKVSRQSRKCSSGRRFIRLRRRFWTPPGSQDDRLTTAVNDGAGFGTVRRNIAFNQISGTDPPTLTGQLQTSWMTYGE